MLQMVYECYNIDTGSPEIGDLLVERVREDDSEGHALRRLVGSVAEHDALHNKPM